MDEVKTQPEEAPEQETQNYTVKAYGGFALTVKDAKSKDYVEGFIRATLQKDVPGFQIINLEIEVAEE